jgi:hypothetical protein
MSEWNPNSKKTLEIAKIEKTLRKPLGPHIEKIHIYSADTHELNLMLAKIDHTLVK